MPPADPQRALMAAAVGTAGTAHAYAQVRSAIVENRYPPGYRLVEQRIAEELGLSRTPVREALRMLQAEGLVVSERNRGAMVRPLSSSRKGRSWAASLRCRRARSGSAGITSSGSSASPTRVRTRSNT